MQTAFRSLQGAPDRRGPSGLLMACYASWGAGEADRAHAGPDERVFSVYQVFA